LKRDIISFFIKCSNRLLISADCYLIFTKL
jgi:hypothetical protein